MAYHTLGTLYRGETTGRGRRHVHLPYVQGTLATANPAISGKKERRAIFYCLILIERMAILAGEIPSRLWHVISWTRLYCIRGDTPELEPLQLAPRVLNVFSARKAVTADDGII